MAGLTARPLLYSSKQEGVKKVEVKVNELKTMWETIEEKARAQKGVGEEFSLRWANLIDDHHRGEIAKYRLKNLQTEEVLNGSVCLSETDSKAVVLSQEQEVEFEKLATAYAKVLTSVNNFIEVNDLDYDQIWDKANQWFDKSTEQSKPQSRDVEQELVIPFWVDVYCGHYKGKGTLFEEPGECGWSGIVAVEKESYEYGNASTRCQSCGAELTQDMDSFEPAPEPENAAKGDVSVENSSL